MHRNLIAAAILLAVLPALSLLTETERVNAQQKAAGNTHMSAETMTKEMKNMNEMMVHHLGEGDANYEKRFIDMMIPHHEGAIMMAEHALEHSDKPELKKMAKQMIDSQQKEIDQLRKWRKEWYSSTRK